MTTIHDRILMVIEEKNPQKVLMKAISAGAGIEIVNFILDHTSFDASSLALPRLMVALMETYQQKDGSIKLPESLLQGW